MNVPTLIYKAVFDSEASGLIGMTFLKNFVFPIDADHLLLELRPRGETNAKAMNNKAAKSSKTAKK